MDGTVPTPSHIAGGRGLLIPVFLNPDLAFSVGGGEGEHVAQTLGTVVGCVQILGQVYIVREKEKYVYMTGFLYCTAEIDTTL